MPAVVQHLSGLVDSLDVASAIEMRTALDTPMPASRVSFAGPGKTPAELTQAIAAGVTIEMESETESERVAAIGERLGIRPRVAVRVNPDFEVKGSGMRLGGGPQQFGIDSEQVPALLNELAAADIEFLGFHIFAGSQNLHADILCDAQRKTVALALRLADAAPMPVSYLNIGGGFGIPYLRARRAARSARHRGESGRPARRIDPSDTSVTPESSSSSAATSSASAASTSPASRPQGFPRPDLPRRRRRASPSARRIGQLRPGHPAQLSRRDRQPHRRRCHRERSPSSAACARHWTCWATTSSLPTAEIGDLVAVFQAGAYGLTASPTAFLSHPAPVEVLV